MSGHETVDQLRTIAKEEQQERSRRIMHSVSIVVESAHDDCDALPTALHQAATNDSDFAQELTRDTDPETGRHLPRKERHQSSPMILLDDHLAGKLAHPCRTSSSHSVHPSFRPFVCL